MVSAIIKKKKKEHKKAKANCYEKEVAYQEACSRAACFNCEIDEADTSLPFEKRYSRCKKASYCVRAVKNHAELIKAMREHDEAMMEYAKAIFEEFSNVKPILYNRITKKDAKWEDCFPAKFSDVIKEDKINSLISLIELDGGRYRLK